MLLGFGYYLYKFVIFYYFFFQKAENNISEKKLVGQSFGLLFLFLLKIGSAGPADQQINLDSPKLY